MMIELKECLLWKETEINRHEGCSKYEECLSVAVSRKYKSWSCKGCEDYDPQVIRIEIYRESETMPPIMRGVDVNKINKQLTKKMAEMGIPKMGPGGVLTAVTEMRNSK